MLHQRWQLTCQNGDTGSGLHQLARPTPTTLPLLFSWTSWLRIPGASCAPRPHGSNPCGSFLGRRIWMLCDPPCILSLCQPMVAPAPSSSGGKVRRCRSVLSYFLSAGFWIHHFQHSSASLRGPSCSAYLHPFGFRMHYGVPLDACPSPGNACWGCASKRKPPGVRCRLEPSLADFFIAVPKGGHTRGCVLFRLPCKLRPCCIPTSRRTSFWPGWVPMPLSPYSLHLCRGLRASCCYASFFPFAMRRRSHLPGPRPTFWEFTPLKLHCSVTVGNFSFGKTFSANKAIIVHLSRACLTSTDATMSQLH